MPAKIHVLFLSGYGMSVGMEQSLVEEGGFDDQSKFGVQHVWVADPTDLEDSSGYLLGVDAAIREIVSGKYHAIVVVNYCNPDMEEEFESNFGRLLQKFVEAGGVLAFPSLEVLSSLSNLFETTWTKSSYYRTNWGPCPENMEVVRQSFGNGHYSQRIIAQHSVKGVSLRNVPPHERCFGVTETSRTQSLVPHMSGLDVSRQQEPDSVMIQELDEDYDIIVALHDYGIGCLAYFGDVNCEEMTAKLIEAFVCSRCPNDPIDYFTWLDESKFSKALEYKQLGNENYQQGDYHGAMEHYNTAIAMYEMSWGAVGTQRSTLVVLYSNGAMTALKQKKWLVAEDYASKALQLDETHDKSLYRRALARFEGGKATGNLVLLRAAKKDVTTFAGRGQHAPDVSKKTELLMAKIAHEEKRLSRK